MSEETIKDEYRTAVLEVNHDVRNHLNVIQGVLEFVAEDEGIGMLSKDFINKGLKELQLLKYLWLNLNLLVKLQKNVVTPKVERFRGSQLIEEMSRLAGIDDWPFEINPNIVICSDRFLLAVALINLAKLGIENLRTSLNPRFSVFCRKQIWHRTTANQFDVSTGRYNSVFFEVLFRVSWLLEDIVMDDGGN